MDQKPTLFTLWCIMLYNGCVRVCVGAMVPHEAQPYKIKTFFLYVHIIAKPQCNQHNNNDTHQANNQASPINNF